MNEPGKKNIRELDKQSEVFHLEHRGSEHLRITRVQLSLKKLELLHLHAVHLGFRRDPFGIGDVLGHGGNLTHVRARPAGLVALGQSHDALPGPHSAGWDL